MKIVKLFEIIGYWKCLMLVRFPVSPALNKGIWNCSLKIYKKHPQNLIVGDSPSLVKSEIKCSYLHIPATVLPVIFIFI